jgi:ferredoxin
MTNCIITYGTERHTFEAKVGSRLLDAILDHESEHMHVCGGNGFCTSCRVTVEEGKLSPPSRLERERLGARCGELRLACQSYITGDVTVTPAVRASLIDWE